MRPVSRHEVDGQPKKVEGQRLVEVYQRGYNAIVQPILSLNAEVHWFDGNHEAWAYQLANRFPGIDGMIDPFSYMQLRDKGVTFHPQGEIFRLGKLSFCHGDGLVKGGKHVAAKAV
jgi:hypothetical protein